MRLRNLRKECSLLKKAMDRVNDVVGRNNFSVFGANIRSHLHWLVSGALVDKLVELPMAIKDIAVEFDNLERKIAQNIELSGDFENSHEKLKKTSKRLVISSFDIANEYGMEMKDVMMMMQIMSRRFKDPTELKYFTRLAAIMSKLDFVEPAVAAETLESVILSFGLNAKQASDFVNEFSIATHTMRINGQDLLEALQRSAPVLKQWGYSTADAVAVISTLSTTLGREGKYIGNAVTGILSRLLTPKAKKIFDELGISMKKVNGEAKSGSEIFEEYLDHYKTLSQDAKKDELWNIFGTYRVTPSTSYLDAFDLFVEAREKIKKASSETTEGLLEMQTDSHESKLNRFSNALNICAYVIGDIFAPAVTEVLEFLTELISKIALFGEYHKRVVEFVFAIVGALFSLWGVIGRINSRFGSLGMACATTKGKIKSLAAGISRLGTNMISLVPVTSRVGASMIQLGSTAVGSLTAISAAAFAAIAAVAVLNSITHNMDQEDRTRTILDDIEEKYKSIDDIPEDQTALRKWVSQYKTIEQDKKNAGVFSSDSMSANMVGSVYTDAPEKVAEHETLTTEISDVIRSDKQMKRTQELIDQLTGKQPEIGTQNSVVDKNDSGSEAAKEAKEKARREKSILDALASKYKTEAELSQRAYDSLMGDIGFDQEIFGANPKNVSQSLYAKTNRQAELRSQIASRNRFIEELRGKYNSKLGDYQYVPSANFKALEDEMTKTLGTTYESTGSYVKEMLAKVGASVTNTDLVKQVQEFKDKNKFFTDFSKVKLGDTIYWSGSDDQENKDINYAGIYMGGNAVQFAGANGVGAVSLSDVKGIQGYGSTGVGDLKAEDLESLEDDNPIANTLAEYLKKIDEFQKLNEEDREKIKEIGRELKRGYLISDDKRFEEQKNRLKTEEETALLDNTNRVNAYNNMVLTNKKLEYAQKNLAVLQEEYKKAFNERMDWAKRLADLESEATDNMTKEQLEAHEVAVNTAKRNLELAQDTEAEKLLAVKKTNDEIEQLEYQRTQKIREGLHSVVHDFLLEGKSWKDIWSQLWSDLADEALRALMGIENGGQSMLGAIAAKAFGLDKENPNGEIAPQIESVNTNTNAMERNTAAITNLTNTLGSGQGSQNGTQSVSSITQSVAEVVEDAAPKWADEMDSVSSEELARKEGKNKDAMQMLTALGVVGAALSMSGSRKMQKFGALLSIATPFIGRGKGKKLSHSGSIVGVTPMATRYYHNGGMVGTAVTPYLKSDEVNAVLQTGEEVVSRKDRRTSEIMSEQNKYMADAMERMSANSNTNVTFAIQAIDSKSVVQLLNENGDAIMNILRKQSAYGNGRV